MKYIFSERNSSKPFNHCVRLLYIQTKMLKRSLLGYYYDSLYDNDGHYVQNQSTQMENALTVMCTFSVSIIPKWRRKMLKTLEHGTK